MGRGGWRYTINHVAKPAALGVDCVYWICARMHEAVNWTSVCIYASSSPRKAVSCACSRDGYRPEIAVSMNHKQIYSGARSVCACDEGGEQSQNTLHNIKILVLAVEGNILPGG